MNEFTYNGISSSTFDIRVEHFPDYSIPRRILNTITVPGRNGDLIQETGAYSNFKREYDIYFNAKSNGFYVDAPEVANWLCGTPGYHVLSDSYDPDVFLMAYVDDQDDLRNFMNYMGRTTVEFNCKPQRWLVSGQTEIEVTSGDTITNSYMPTYPLFKLTGSGTLDVNGNQIAISNNLNKTIYIDCDTQNAYTGTENRNSDIRITGVFPYFETGDNVVTFNNASCTVVPRWWRL